jgi:hypothetical protein
MTTDAVAGATLSDGELVLHFESLGDNCELGILQRRLGAEPLGLFRFAGAPLRHLVRAMEARFAGIADPDHVRVQPENGEYMIKLTKYDFIYHADVKINEADPAALHRQHVRTVGFLVDKLISDLENPVKIMVFRQNEPLAANDLLDLRAALEAYGPAVLLWVQAARAGFPAGEVVVVDDRLMVGYVRRLARRENVPDLDVPSWLAMLRKAYAARPVAAPAPVVRPGIELTFGKAGNATALTGSGWSAPENGFTWTIGGQSLLTLPNPGAAAYYVLEIDVVPYAAPPALAGQALRIDVNGEQVGTFDLVPRGVSACIVPGRLMLGRDVAEIVMNHPNAASPRDVTGQDDVRPLAFAFRRLSLIGA